MTVIDTLQFAALVDSSLHARSGSVFYTGRSAFGAPSKLYVLGLNPGGSPISQAHETVGRDLADWQALPPRWSAYKDESWRNMVPGTCGMQPRILHMFEQLGLNPHDVPASNVVFVRSNREAALVAEMSDLLKLCWPVHRAVMEKLGVSTVLCLGGKAGRWVRSLVGAHGKVAQFIERNARGWTSEAHRSSAGVSVVTVTHPASLIGEIRRRTQRRSCEKCSLSKGQADPGSRPG